MKIYTVFYDSDFNSGGNIMAQNSFKKIAMKVSIISIIVNLILSVFKFIVGVIANSGAMISDAIHSSSDVFSTFIVIIGVNIAGKKSDKKHQYGHERFECIASILLAVTLFMTGIVIGISGIKKVFLTENGVFKTPGMLALVAAVLSIAVKEWMYWFTRAAAKKINSGALMADAWHHRSDALSSIGSFAGILGARLGLPVLDPIASVIICLFIIKAALDIFKDAVNKLVDVSCDDETIQKLKSLVLSQDGVLGIDDIKTRVFASKIYVDLEIRADGNQSLYAAHKIAEQVHSIVEKKFPQIIHCMVYVNPVEEKIEVPK